MKVNSSILYKHSMNTVVSTTYSNLFISNKLGDAECHGFIKCYKRYNLRHINVKD